MAFTFVFSPSRFPPLSSDHVLEDGCTVTTVADGHKLKINPYSAISPPGTSDLIVLDSSDSVFCTLSFPLPQESVVKQLSGDGTKGYSDGELGSAHFNQPRSFAVDMKGNGFVADKNNNVIRNITNSVSSLLTGRPNLLFSSVMWRHYLINLVRQVRSHCFDIRSVTACSTLCALLKRLLWSSLSRLSLVFRIDNLESITPPKDFESWLDSDDLGRCEIKKAQIFSEQLKDLISSD